MTISLKKIPGEYWIAQLKNLESNVIEKIRIESTDFWTVSESTDEISIVSRVSDHESFQSVEGPWSAFRIVGQLDFSLTGILSRCSSLLAEAKISIFAVSTFDTDYFLVRKGSEGDAISAWRSGGITVHNY